MRKIAIALIALTMSIAAQAQYTTTYTTTYTTYKTTPFHADKVFFGAALTGLDLNYSGKQDFKLGAQAQVGYFVFDNVALIGEAAFNNNGKAPNSFSVGAGGRFYIEQNGIFLGAKVSYLHANKNFNDLQPGVELGYSFFLSRTVTIEPSVYYNQSFKNHSDYSNLGFKIGFGIYLND